MYPRLIAALAAFVLFLPPPSGATEQGPANPPVAPSTTPMADFQGLIAEGGMTFLMPDGFQDREPRTNPLLPYEKAVGSADGRLEIRYAIRPLGRIVIDYQDPHNAAPDPNHVFPLMYQSLVTALSEGRHSPTREYPKEQAQEKFNADWAAAAVFDITPAFRADHEQALLIAIHKNGRADAYSVFLFDDYDQVKQSINENLNALAFLP